MNTPAGERPGDAASTNRPSRRRAASIAQQRRAALKLGGDWRAIQPFSAGQRRAIAGLLLVGIAVVAVGLWRDPIAVPDPLPADAPRASDLLDRIDPNTASAAMLSALPQLGEGRAQAIVDYRERAQRGDTDRVVFADVDDLLRVRGIGMSLSRQIEPYLTFPGRPPATAPVHED